MKVTPLKFRVGDFLGTVVDFTIVALPAHARTRPEPRRRRAACANRHPGRVRLHDTRLVGKVGLTTTVFARLSIGFGFTVKYDQNPAPRPIPSGTPAGLVYVPGFQPFAYKVDTLAEASLIYTLI